MRSVRHGGMRTAVPRPAVHGGRAPADPPAGGVGRGRLSRPQPAHRSHLPHRLAQRQQISRARHILHQRLLCRCINGVSIVRLDYMLFLTKYTYFTRSLYNITQLLKHWFWSFSFKLITLSRWIEPRPIA